MLCEEEECIKEVKQQIMNQKTIIKQLELKLA